MSTAALPPTAPFASGDWLRAQRGQPWLRVVDCQWQLGDPAAGHALYELGHIPGAAFMDLDADLSGRRADEPNRLGRHPLPSPEAFIASARRAGITRTGIVVAYDQGMTGGAARLWWLLRHVGKREVLVLEGGLAAWHGELEAGSPPIPAGDIELSGTAGDLVDHQAVLAATAAGTAVVVDSRAAERYRGETEPIDPVAGHVPGALSAPLAEPLPQWLLDDPRPVVAYCGSGVSACVTLLQLAAAGREDTSLYVGSWSDWIARDLPIATG